jgi:hypothetical protein
MLGSQSGGTPSVSAPPSVKGTESSEGSMTTVALANHLEPR